MTIKTAVASLSLLALIAVAAPAAADTLLIERTAFLNQGAVPARGASMSEVEARYGAPPQRLDPRGGQKRQWPTINRWSYPQFTVYFEKDRVIDVVANHQAVSTEIGPAPAIR